MRDAANLEVMPGVNVVFALGQGTATDVNGDFRMELPAGSYNITFTFIGYRTIERSVLLIPGSEQRLEVNLEQAVSELEMVVVSAGRFEQRVGEVSQSLSVLSPQLVRDKNLNNMSDALQQVPGVVIIDEDPQIRAGSGFSYGAGSRVMVLVDDLPVLSGDIGRISWGFLPTENLEQLEVIKGASSVLYGSAALSGVINVRTAYPRSTPTTLVNAFTGLYDTPRRKSAKWWTGRNPLMGGANLFHSQQLGTLDVVLGANYVWDEGFLGPEPIGDDSLNTDDTRYSDPAGYDRRLRVNGGLRWRSKKVKGLNIGVNGNYSRSENTSVFIWEDNEDGLYRPENGTVTYTNGVQYYVDPYINYSSAQNTRHSLRGRYYRQSFDNSGNQSNRSNFAYGEYQIQQRADLFGETMLTGGIVAQHTRSVADLYSGNSDGDNENFATNTAAYLQVDKKLFRERLALSLGMRYERFQVNDDEQSTPVFRAGGTYKVFEATFVRASYGQGFRFPTIGERFITTNVGQLQIYPNPELLPEESWNVEAGIKQGFKIGDFQGYLDLVGFRQEFQNYIEFTFGIWDQPSFTNFGGLGFRSVNTGGALVSGGEVELTGQGNVGPVKVSALMGYTYTEPISTTPDQIYAYPQAENTTWPPATYANTSSDPTGNILKFRVQHLFRSDIQGDLKRMSLGFSVRYNSHVRNIDKIFVDLDESTNPIVKLETGVSDWMKTHRTGDTILDLRLGYMLTEHSRVWFIVNNLTNLEYAIRPLSVEAPRMFQLKYSLQIGA
ncbi:MAG: TonB-dependent receptor [Flavobacteriales bacterium]|nr:TonB-dependent receptor [Flavobacteriales bacterium]